ncbi:SDR family oxidoreductase [Nannocystaceae bacterium ST9]
MARVLIAGASGELGRQVVSEALARGHRVVALGRDAARLAARLPEGVEARIGDALAPASLVGALDGCEAVISCLGASVSPSVRAGRRGYLATDLPANRALADAAKAAGVARFVYVSVAGHDLPGAAELAYYRAHEGVVEHLDAIGLEHAIIRPTGFFSALAQYVEMARAGRVPMIGDGTARSNPIADADLARICVDALEGPARDRTVGGPDVLSRREMIELAFAAVERPAKISSASPGMFAFAGKLMGVFVPRLAELLPFVIFVSTHDVIAPIAGSRRLVDAFREAARARGAGSP